MNHESLFGLSLFSSYYGLPFCKHSSLLLSRYCCCSVMVSSVLFSITIINFFVVVNFFHLDQNPQPCFCHETKCSSMIIFSISNKCKITEVHRFLCHIMTTITYFCLKLIFFSVITNNILMSAISFISICDF